MTNSEKNVARREKTQQKLESGLVSEHFPKVSSIVIDVTNSYGKINPITVLRTLNFWPNTLRAINDWMASMTRLGNHVFVVASAFAVAVILIGQGRLREAVRTYEEALQLAAEAGPEAQAITAHHHLGLALLYRELGNTESFAQHWQKAEELGKQTTLVDWPHRWHVAQARVKESEGDFDAALDLLDEAKRVYVKNPAPDLRPVEALKARVYLKQGRLDKVQAWVAERGLSVGDEAGYLREFEPLTLARVLTAVREDAVDARGGVVVTGEEARRGACAEPAARRRLWRFRPGHARPQQGLGAGAGRSSAAATPENPPRR